MEVIRAVICRGTLLSVIEAAEVIRDHPAVLDPFPQYLDAINLTRPRNLVYAYCRRFPTAFLPAAAQPIDT